MTERDLIPYHFIVGTVTIKETKINNNVITMDCGFDSITHSTTLRIYLEEETDGKRTVKNASKTYYTFRNNAIKNAQATFNRYCREAKKGATK